MEVRDWMTEQVETAHPDDDVASVRARLGSRRVRQFPVVEAGKLVGIISDRDLRGSKDGDARVGALMTPDPLTTSPRTPIEDAAALLRAGKVGALPVVERGMLVGIISESDLLQALVELLGVVEPTTMLDLECADGMRGVQRARAVIERQQGQILWMRATVEPTGRLRLRLRVRTDIGHAPEQALEEAGFHVASCIIAGASPSGGPTSACPM